MVLPGVADVMANAFLCVSILIKLLFPTLLLPISAYSGKFTSGHISSAAAGYKIGCLDLHYS